LLIDYMEEHDCIALGTLEVRQYLGERPSFAPPAPETEAAFFPTAGAENRYRNVLFIEKEGFHSILEAARLQERFDCAVMSTKGMSVTAARMLIDRLTPHVDNIFVLHDFDVSGFSVQTGMLSGMPVGISPSRTLGEAWPRRRLPARHPCLAPQANGLAQSGLS
jgi:hypothetical protein